MDRLISDCWVWSPRPPLCLHPQHSGSLSSVLLRHQEEEEEEEEGGHYAVFCYPAGCVDLVSPAADARWSTSVPAVHSEIPGSSVLAGRAPSAPSSQQPKTVSEADGADLSQHSIGGHHWEGPGTETQGCVCVHGQREPECLGPCWPGSPYVYYGAARRNLVVGVEVVEEVAVEDTLEVITDNIHADELLGPELLQDLQLYPT